jgi:hypothetical protein
MCKYKSKSVIVDADQWIYEPNTEPENIPKGVYKKQWNFDSNGENIFYQWGIDGMYSFIALKPGDWIVRHPDEKWVRVYSDVEFQTKYESLIWMK